MAKKIYKAKNKQEADLLNRMRTVAQFQATSGKSLAGVYNDIDNGKLSVIELSKKVTIVVTDK